MNPTFEPGDTLLIGNVAIGDTMVVMVSDKPVRNGIGDTVLFYDYNTYEVMTIKSGDHHQYPIGQTWIFVHEFWMNVKKIDINEAS